MRYLGVILGLAALAAGCHSAAELADETGFPVANPGAVAPVGAPPAGPYLHTVRTASSSDGLTFQDERNADLVLHASVPAAVQFAGTTLRVYFVDFSSGTPERLGCVESNDGGAHYHWAGCVINGLTSVKAVDPCPVPLPDGRVRLYYYASSNNVNSTDPHNVDAAISSDGVHFTREGTVFTAEGLVDPDVFWTGTQWVMHVFSLTVGGTVVATSTDGLSFQQQGILQPAHYGVTRPVLLPDGTFRMYAFHQPDATAFVSLHSPDGLAWSLESGTRFTVPAGSHITDPFVVRRADGSWLMAYKQGPP